MNRVGEMLKFIEACQTENRGQTGWIGVLVFTLCVSFLAGETDRLEQDTGREGDRQCEEPSFPSSHLPFTAFYLIKKHFSC